MLYALNATGIHIPDTLFGWIRAMAQRLDEFFGVDLSDIPANMNFDLTDEQRRKLLGQSLYGYQCPYCLFFDKGINIFLTVGKKGNISRSKGKCPKCGIILNRKILVQTVFMTIAEYGQWIAQCSHNHIRGLKWDCIRAWLGSNHVSNEFWEAYYKERKRLDPGYIPRSQRTIENENSISNTTPESTGDK